MKRPPLVEVEWVDSAVYAEWAPREDHEDDAFAECCSAGYMLKKNKKAIVVALSLHRNRAANSMTIPIQCVKSIRRLKR